MEALGRNPMVHIQYIYIFLNLATLANVNKMCLAKGARNEMSS